MASFGGSTEGVVGKERTRTDGTRSGTTRESLDISDEAVEKIVADILGGAGGLAEIFQGEQTAGIFSSSVSAQAAGDLASKLAGEIAKLRAVKTTAEDEEFEEFTSKQEDRFTLGTFGKGTYGGT